MVDVLLCGDPNPPNHRFKKRMCCLLLFNRQPIRFYNNSIINGTGDMSSMTIKMKMAQDELILSGVQVPTITPAPVSTSLVQETSPTTALPEREVQEQIYKERGIDRGESNL